MSYLGRHGGIRDVMDERLGGSKGCDRAYERCSGQARERRRLLLGVDIVYGQARLGRCGIERQYIGRGSRGGRDAEARYGSRPCVHGRTGRLWRIVVGRVDGLDAVAGGSAGSQRIRVVKVERGAWDIVAGRLVIAVDGHPRPAVVGLYDVVVNTRRGVPGIVLVGRRGPAYPRVAVTGRR